MMTETDYPQVPPAGGTDTPPRRRFLERALALGAMAVAAPAARSRPTGAGADTAAGSRAAAAPLRRALPIPPRLRGHPLPDGTLGYQLRVGTGTSELLAGLRTPTWGYNGALLGPALVVPRGQSVRISVRNGLHQSTSVHWHGAHAPGDMDGGPHSPIAAGATAEVHFALDQPAATLWYHPHVHGRTGPQVYAGLAGLLLIDDGVDRRLGLPHRWGVDDIPLIVQDRRIDADGTLLYMNAMMDMMGMKGDRFLVNGVEGPYVDVPAQQVRLRLLNGSNARLYNFAFADGRAFHVVASDGGLLARPVELRSLLLAPAERAEIVVDLTRDQGRAVVLGSDSGRVIPDLGMPMGTDAFDARGFALLELRVGSPSGRAARLPGSLVPLPTLDTSRPARRFSLQGMMGSMGGGGMMGGGMMGGGMMGMMGGRTIRNMVSAASGPGGMDMGVGGRDVFSINHAFMDMAVINQRVRLGDTEVWEVRNDAPMAHPFHVHGTSFRILEREGLPPLEHERGWKDVVLVAPNETVRLIMHFGQPAGPGHPFMYHCHVLEHEDNGMMGQFSVT